jgi:ADP-ribosyl-[dinitrogen reductase] hydrolase
MSDVAAQFDRALGAYLGLAIGDALGASVEFMRPLEIRAAFGVHRDIVGGGWLKLARGQVTDDTTLSLALGDALLGAGPEGLRDFVARGDDRLPHRIGAAFVAWLRARPVDCGNTCRRGIRRYMHDASLSGEEQVGDAGNGALMRNLPAALATLGAPRAHAALALAQARLTHHNPLSDAATLGLGELTQLLLGGADAAACRAWAGSWCAGHPEFAFDPYPGRASAYVVDTVQTVLHYFLAHADDFEAALVGCVNQGEDADTTGALVGMLAGARCGASALPRRWLERLQPGVVRAITDQCSGLLALARALAESSDGARP